jgi:hypothetical protein
MSGCGRNCACACGADEKETETCAAPEGGVTLDKDGKCPCGKAKEDCCHSDLIDEKELTKTA